MVGNTGTLMSMRLVRSKLRKRDESSSAPQVVAVQTTTQPTNTIDLYTRSSPSNGSLRGCQQRGLQISLTDNGVETLTECDHVGRTSREVSFVRTSGVSSSIQPNSWVFPPKAPTPHIYNCMNDTLLAVNDKNGFKGFRKQFSGRFKRLVSKKPEPAPAIPPELKPQLKTIYVY